MRWIITLLMRSFSACLPIATILWILIGISAPSGPSAQEKPAPTPAIQTAAPTHSDFSKEAIVVDKLYTRLREEKDGTGTRETTARIRILADAGVKEMAVLTFTYTALNQQIDIGYVRVIKPDGTVVVTPDYNVQDLPADVTRSAPMYSDIHQKHVAVKGLGVGDTLEYQVTLKTLKPEVPGHFWFEYSFEKNLIDLDEQVDLDVPADKKVTVASADIQPTVSTASGRKLYHWASSNLARPDPDAPPKSIKHLKPSVQVTTFSNWEQVGAWYQALQRDSLTVTPAIQAKVAALTKGLTSDEDKARAIFNDVALHIHYVGLEFGIGRYQPHPADDVLSNEYGDCKDKHTLLATELKAAGIQAWPVLISSGRELDPATPSPAQFNHVITLVPLDGKLLWMDSTEEVAPIGEMITTLRDKQALAIPDGKPAYLERTPVDLPFTQSARFQVEGKLSDQGVFTGHIVQTYHGDAELLLRAVFRQVPQSQWKTAVQQFSQNIGFAGDVSNPEFSEIEQISQPLQISYDYSREKFGDWDDHRIYPSMPSTGWSLAPGVKEKKPADPPEIGSPGEQDYLSTITLPKDWYLVPQTGIDLKEDWAEYHSTYSLKKGGVFAAERRLVIKKNQVPLEDWEKYLAFRRSIYADEVRTTYLEGGSSASGAVISGNDQIENEIARQKATAAMEPYRDAKAVLESDPPASSSDLVKTASDCRKMVSDTEAASTEFSLEDPHSLRWAQVLNAAWTCLGWAEFEAREPDAAERYLRAAWELSQSATSGYQLARLLEAKGNKTEAAHLYELASVTWLDMTPGEATTSQIAESYRRLTGNELTATPYKNGAYDGSLRQELDKLTQVHPIIKTTKLNGTAYFMAVFEAGKPTRFQLFGGDKVLASLVPTLQTHAFQNILPQGSKGRLVREIRVICTQWAGCDADLLLPNALQMSFPTFVNVTKPMDVPAGTKLVPMKPQH